MKTSLLMATLVASALSAPLAFGAGPKVKTLSPAHRLCRCQVQRRQPRQQKDDNERAASDVGRQRPALRVQQPARRRGAYMATITVGVPSFGREAKNKDQWSKPVSTQFHFKLAGGKLVEVTEPAPGPEPK